MKRKYKLIWIISISIVVAYFIYIFNIETKVYLLALGDGISSGTTAYNIDGISYNDYIKEYFESKKILKEYNKNFSKKNYKINDLINDIDNNIIDKKTNLHLKQLIDKSTIITLSIGEEELSKLAITNDLNEKSIKEFLNNYDLLLKKIKKITNNTVVIIGLYENNYLNKANTIILNSEIANLANKYNIIFINVIDLLANKDYFPTNASYYFNYKGHEIIAEIIIHSL